MVTLKAVDKKEVARYLGYRDAEPDEVILKLMEEAEQALSEACHPAYTIGIFETEPVNESTLALKECALVLTGKDIVKHVEGCGMVALLAVTLGGGVDALIRKLQVTNMPMALVADAMAGAMIEQICDDVQAELSQKLPNMRQTWRFSPGYGDLPLSIQAQFLQVVEAGKRIGLSVTDSQMLTPVKSVTAIVGLQDMTKFSGHFTTDTPEDVRNNSVVEGPTDSSDATTESGSTNGAAAERLASPTGCNPVNCSGCAYHDKCGKTSVK